MANVKAKDADASNIYIRARGTGSDSDPYEYVSTDVQSLVTLVTTIKDTLVAQKDYEGLFVMSGGTLYERRVTTKQSDGTSTISFYNADGTIASPQPSGPFTSATGGATGNTISVTSFEGTGTGSIADGALVDRVRVISSAGAVTATSWVDPLTSTAATVSASTDVRIATGRVDEQLATINTQIGLQADAAATSATASSSLMALLKGIFARALAISAQLPTALGQGTSAQSLTTVEASDSALQFPKVRSSKVFCLTSVLSEISLPCVNVKRFEIENRSGAPLRYSHIANNTTATSTYTGIPSTVLYREETNINFTGTLYLSAEALPYPATITATITSGSPNATTATNFLSNTIGQGVVPGQSVTGPGIPAGAFVGSINAAGTSLTLVGADGTTPVNATASGTVALVFSGAIVRFTTWN